MIHSLIETVVVIIQSATYGPKAYAFFYLVVVLILEKYASFGTGIKTLSIIDMHKYSSI